MLGITNVVTGHARTDGGISHDIKLSFDGSQTLHLQHNRCTERETPTITTSTLPVCNLYMRLGSDQNIYAIFCYVSKSSRTSKATQSTTRNDNIPDGSNGPMVFNLATMFSKLPLALPPLHLRKGSSAYG